MRCRRYAGKERKSTRLKLAVYSREGDIPSAVLRSAGIVAVHIQERLSTAIPSGTENIFGPVATIRNTERRPAHTVR